jgi:hypothetical protein
MKLMYELSGRRNQINAFKNGSSECPLLALSGHTRAADSGVKRTCPFALHMSAFDP